jgi:uroporphyrinogen decarboxylase
LEEAVKRFKGQKAITKASPGGGHIMASSNSIHPGVDPQNYKAMVEATKKYGAYPIDANLVKKYRTKNYIKDYY